MESSINSCCSSEAPTMSAQETEPRKGRIAEENMDKETMGADGTQKRKTCTTPLARLPILFQKLVVEKSVADGGGSGLGFCKKAVAKVQTVLNKLESLHRRPDVVLNEQESSHLYVVKENTDKETLGADDRMKEEILSVIADRRNEKPFFTCGRFRALNERSSGSLEGRTQTLDQVMEALADPNIHIMGLHSSNENAIKITDSLPEKVIRRVERDNMFNVILKANVTKRPNIKRIQDEIADGLGLKFDEISETERASILHDNIKIKQKILVVICELYKAIDLRKVGIPYGADHSSCKILLTSTNEDVLSNQMHTQRNFLV